MEIHVHEVYFIGGQEQREREQGIRGYENLTTGMPHSFPSADVRWQSM